MATADNTILADKLQRVRDRLEFVSILSDLNSQFLDPSLIKQVGQKGWTHPWVYFDSLRNYLLLTCFDLLGQSDEYLDFQSWLVAKRCAEERAAVAHQQDSCSNPALVAAQLHRGYLELYGTKNSFYRFVNESLSKKERGDLFHSVRVRKIDAVENREIEIIESESVKLRYLYQLRNEYTHGAQIAGNPSGGVFENWNKPIEVDGKMLMGYVSIRSLPSNGERTEISVRNWPDVLVSCVESVLARTSKRDATK